jgi:hypothetical protein
MTDAMRSQRPLQLLLFQLILVTPLLAPAQEPMRQHQVEGVLVGSVSRGPLTPHEPAHHALRRSLVAGASIDIMTVDNYPVTSVKTDSLGNFDVKLPPGKYRVTMRAVNGARPRNMPAIVIIAAGAKKRLDIFLDTGLR